MMLEHCFWRREKADTLLRYAEPEVVLRADRSFFIYVCGLGDVRA